MCLSLSLLTDEWSFLPCSPNASQTSGKARVSHLVMMWYRPLLFVPFSICFLPVLCTYASCDVLPLAFLFLLQVEVPPPMTGGTLAKEVMIAPSAVPPSVEKEPPSGDVTEKVGQLVTDVQPILPSIPLAVQDLKAFLPPVSEDPQPVQTLNPTKTVSLKPMTEPTLSKKSLRGMSSSIQTSESHLPIINILNLISFIFSF